MIESNKILVESNKTLIESNKILVEYNKILIEYKKKTLIKSFKKKQDRIRVQFRNSEEIARIKHFSNQKNDDIVHIID